MSKAQESIEEMAQRRKAGREGEFRRAKGLHEGISRRSGSLAVGLTEEGELKRTRRLSSFPIVLDKWCVYLGFKHEDRDVLKGMSVAEIEAKLKEGDIPRKMIRLKTHIIRAVRLQKDIRKGYEAEMAETDALLRAMDEANLRLAQIKSRHADADIDEAMSALRQADSALSKKEVVVKRLLTRSRVQKAAEMLEQAKGLAGNKRDFQVSRACAVFTSARNRLSAWRDRQVAGLVEHNLQKECSLRAERDRWLHSQLARFAEIPEKVRLWEQEDQAKLAVLDSIEGMLRKRKPDWDALLAKIAEHSALFRVGNRERRKAEEKIRLMEEGVQPSEHGKTDYQIGHYAWLYRFAAAKEKKKALEKVEYLRLFVNGNKPGFILDELSQSPDLYHGPLLESLDRAVIAYDLFDYYAASAHFAAAREAIRNYCIPG